MLRVSAIRLTLAGSVSEGLWNAVAPPSRRAVTYPSADRALDGGVATRDCASAGLTERTIAIAAAIELTRFETMCCKRLPACRASIRKPLVNDRVRIELYRMEADSAWLSL
jgi:hypothetical protein